MLWGGFRELRRDLPELFNEKLTEWITKEMQKTVLWESKIITRKIYIMAGLIKINEKCPYQTVWYGPYMAQVREWYGVIYGTAMGRMWNWYGTWLLIGDPHVVSIIFFYGIATYFGKGGLHFLPSNFVSLFLFTTWVKVELIWKYTGRGKIAKLYGTGAESCVFIGWSWK